MPVYLRSIIDKPCCLIIRERWRGTVAQVSEEEFDATLRESGDRDLFVCSITRSMVRAEDADLLAPGAVFDWVVGDEFSSLRFRREVWTAEEIARVRSEAEHMYLEFWQPSSLTTVAYDAITSSPLDVTSRATGTQNSEAATEPPRVTDESKNNRP